MKTQIEFIYQTDFELSDENAYAEWLGRCASLYDTKSLILAFAFMDDASLCDLNIKHLNHDTLTDIITFDDSVGLDIEANIAISIERVKANAKEYAQLFENELLRVMSHGLLHCLGLGDKTENEVKAMRLAEEQCIKLFHVEQKPQNNV